MTNEILGTAVGMDGTVVCVIDKCGDLYRVAVRSTATHPKRKSTKGLAAQVWPSWNWNVSKGDTVDDAMLTCLEEIRPLWFAPIFELLMAARDDYSAKKSQQ